MLVDRIVQFSPLVRDMDEGLDAVHAFLGAFPSRRNRLEGTGVDLAIYPFGNETFMELVAPFDSASAAHRLLTRTGEGWFMLNIDLRDDVPVADIDAHICSTGVRVVTPGVHPDGQSGTWHIHPQDAGGVLLALYVRPDRPDHVDWAGPTWKHFVETNRRVVDSILGVSVATGDLAATSALYNSLGFRFSSEFKDEGDQVLQADLPGGTFLQLRCPTSKSSLLGEWLERKGPGLYHMAWKVRARASLDEALQRVGGQITRESGEGSRQSLWATVPGVFGMPLEFRLAGPGPHD